MNLVDKVKKAGIVLATATGISVGLGATAALADCSAIVSAPNGQTIDGKKQSARVVLHIRAGLKYTDAQGKPQVVKGPPTAWEACSLFADRVYSLAKPFGAVGYRTKMECSGSWVGRYCRDVESTGSVNYNNYSTYGSVNSLTRALQAASGRAAVQIETAPARRAAATSSFGAATAPAQPRRAAAEETGGRKQVGTLPGGYKVYKCEC